MTSNTCPDANILSQFVLGELPDEAMDEWRHHVRSCKRCMARANRLRIASRVGNAGQPGPALVEDDRQRVALAESVPNEILGPNQAETHRADETITPTTDTLPDADDSSEFAQLLSPPESAEELGRLGGYRVLEVLGEGGMGVVFKAQDLRLERLVALKAMKPAVASRSSFTQRFIREAKATAAIEHHNIVQIYQVGEDRGIPFIAMQFLRGESLQQRLDRKQRLSQPEVLEIGRDVASGLQAAHETGLIHRDIKPDNIWLDKKSGFAKVLDFGLVRCADDDTGLTRTGMIMGTPRYMAPEQAQGGAVDHRSDLFSLGSVLYHIASGQAAFEGSNLTAMLIAVAQANPRPVSEVAPDLNPALAELIMRLLAKDPDDRPQTAAEVVDELRRIEAQPAEPTAAAPAIEISVETRSPRKRKQARPKTTQPARRRSKTAAGAGWWRRRTIWIAAGFGALLLLAGIVFRFRSPDGTVVVELNGPLEVATVEVDDREIQFSPDGERKVLFQVDPGKHSLRIKTSDGVVLTTTLAEKPLTIEAGEEIKLRAWVERKVAARRNKRLPQERKQVSLSKRTKTAVTQGATGSSSTLPELAKEPSSTAPLFQPLPPLGSWRPFGTANLDLQFPSQSLAGADTLPGLAHRPAKLQGIRRWNVETRMPRGLITSVCFSPDSRLLAVGTNSGGVRIFDAETLKLHHFLPTLLGVNTLQFIDNETLSATVDGSARLLIWRLDGTTIADLGSSSAHSFSPDRQRCISQCNYQTHLRDGSGKILRVLIKKELGRYVSPKRALAWSHDGRFVAALYDDHVLRVWDRDGEPVNEFKVDGLMHYMAEPIAWSPDGKWIGVISEHQPATILRFKPSGEQGPPIQVAERGMIMHFVWSPDGKQIFASGEGLGSITDVETGMIRPVGGYVGGINGFAISADGTRVATTYPHLTVWDSQANQIAQLPLAERNLTTTAHWSPDGQHFVTAGYQREFGLWQEDGRYQHRIAPYFSAGSIVAWYPDGSRMALIGSQESKLILADIEGNSSVVDNFSYRHLEYSPSGRYLVAAVYRDGAYHIDLLSRIGELLKTIHSSKEEFSIRCHPQRDMLAILAGDTIYTADASDGWRLREISDHPPLERGGMIWSPHGQRILIGGQPFEFSTSRLTRLSDMVIRRPITWDWSPDGRRLAHCYGNGLAFVDAESGKPLRKIIRMRGDNYKSIDWHPRRNMVLVADYADAITCWDASAMEPYWQAIILPQHRTVTLTGAGQILHGDRQQIEQALVYYVEKDDGSLELLKPSEFAKRIGESIFVSESP